MPQRPKASAPRPVTSGGGPAYPRTIPLLTDLTATGDIVDGDTIRLGNGSNGRLYGFDAFEKGQPGYRPDGSRINLGDLSAGALSAYIRPSQSVIANGKQTYGRPVITLGNGADDPAINMLWQGAGYAAPEYLRDDPQRAASYTEAERLGRLNRQGGFGAGHIRPDAYRRPLTTRTAKLATDEFLAFDDQLPEDAPKLKRLTPEQEKKIGAYVASQAGNKNFSIQQYRDWFRNDLGVTDIEPADNPQFIADVRKGAGFSPAVDYSGLDTEAKRELEELIAFSGLRPEDAQGYRDLLKGADQATVLDYARSKGMTLDPRDVSAYFEARAKGGSAPIPLPLINPGDGRTGAAARGFGDPLGFIDEMGGVVDALGGTENRESIWNSDRSFGEIYDNNTRQNRAVIDYDETNHPGWRFGGQMVSGLALPGSIGVRGAAGYAKAGGAIGGIYGFGSADGTIGQRFANVPLNAAGGAILGASLGKGVDLLGPLIGKGASKMRGFGRGASDSVPIAPVGEPGSLVPHAGVADDLPPGFAIDEAPTVGQAAARPRDTLDIAPGPAGPLPVPALGVRVPSAPTLGGDLGRSRNWIDIAQQPAPTGGTVLEQVQAIGQRMGQGRANMAGDAMPSLSSPRLRDVIDIGANRTTRLMDGPTDAMMRTAAARVDPGDVLPRAANEVQSLDEFNRISQDLYPEVRAPNERDALTSRQFPSRTDPSKSFNRRGPLDLAAYVREQGGVADFRGELKAAGLSNAARKGDDFVGGENRLGRLLNDENGSTLDDMAQRAWEAGYFPDHDQRPTVDEFVTALGDTYRGVNRTFRPDDYAELDAYGAARDQRFAVERAKQEGAPLADDMGLPATYDDIIANSPPAHAYDDWTNAVVSKVGNIRVDKLESPQDIGQALKIAENVAGGFDAAKRGKISFAETQALAQDLGMTADDLLARRKGQAFSAEEAYAARAILAKSGNELVNLAKRVQSLGAEPGSEALAAFRKAMVRHTAIQEQVSGMTAEAGRALSAFRIAADSRDMPGRVLEGLVAGGGGAERLKDAAEQILTLSRDPANMNRFIEKVSKPTFKDKAVEVWYNFLLSGPQTHMVNMLSNTLTSISQIPEHAVAAGVGAARRAIGREAADRVLLSEVGARTAGLLQGTKEGMRLFANALKTGEATDFVTKLEHQGQKAVSGLKGEVLRLPSRFLTAEDELFKGINRRMEIAGLAVRNAEKEGLKGQEARDRIAELAANPTDEMMLSALEYGRYTTFQAKLGPLASKVSAATNEMPILKAVLPFVRTPTNLFKFFIERSPGAPLLKEVRRDFAAGGAKRDLAIARVMLGTGMGAVVAELAAKGLITGSPPTDDNKRRLMEADGWQPYSVKVGDQYYSYKRLDPFSLTIGAAADLATLSDGMTDKQLDNQAASVVGAIISNLQDKTWLSGISSLLAAADDPERKAGAFFERLAGSAAVPTGVAQVARTLDPTARETPSMGTAIQNRIPGLSDNLLPKRDVWGKPIVSEGGVGPDLLSPIWTKTDRKDPITREALRVGATVSKPQKGDLNPEQYDRLQEVAGSVARKWIGQLIASPEYQALNREAQADEIGDAMTRARKAAKASVLTGEPILDARPEKKQRSAGPAELPRGFKIDALPDGFVIDR